MIYSNPISERLRSRLALIVVIGAFAVAISVIGLR